MHITAREPSIYVFWTLSYYTPLYQNDIKKVRNKPMETSHPMSKEEARAFVPVRGSVQAA